MGYWGNEVGFCCDDGGGKKWVGSLFTIGWTLEGHLLPPHACSSIDPLPASSKKSEQRKNTLGHTDQTHQEAQSHLNSNDDKWKYLRGFLNYECCPFFVDSLYFLAAVMISSILHSTGVLKLLCSCLVWT